MTGNSRDAPTAADATVPPITDPESLVDRDDVDYAERTRIHEHENHYAPNETRAGTAVVGVTDGDRVLMMQNEELSKPSFPFRPVEPGEDYAAVAERAVEDLTGVAVRITAVERVRHVTHRLEADEDRSTTTYDVVFRAEPTGETTVADGAPLEHPDRDHQLPDENPLSVEWITEVPDADDSDDAVLEDIRSILE